MHQASWGFVRIRRLRIFIFCLVGSASRAKPAFVVAFVQGIAPFRSLGLRHSPPEFTHSFVMKRLSRAHEDVIATMLCVQTKRGGHLLEIADDVIGLFFGSAIMALGGALDVYPVLVGAGKKKCLNALLSLLTRNRVRYDHRIEMAQVRDAVGVIDGCGDVKSFHQSCDS